MRVAARSAAAPLSTVRQDLRDLLGLLRRHRVEEVSIERPDGPLVETLWEAGIKVVVISPNQVKNLRAATARPATKMIASMRSCWPTRCGRPGSADAVGP